MASVDPGEVILSGVGVVSGMDLSGSATAVGALSSRPRQLLLAQTRSETYENNVYI